MYKTDVGYVSSFPFLFKRFVSFALLCVIHWKNRRARTLNVENDGEKEQTIEKGNRHCCCRYRENGRVRRRAGPISQPLSCRDVEKDDEEKEEKLCMLTYILLLLKILEVR